MYQAHKLHRVGITQDGEGHARAQIADFLLYLWDCTHMRVCKSAYMCA